MAVLPEEIWCRILEIGIQRNVLNFRDLCSLSMTSRLLSRPSNQDCLWQVLVTQDFPLQEKLKSFYKTSGKGPEGHAAGRDFVSLMGDWHPKKYGKFQEFMLSLNDMPSPESTEQPGLPLAIPTDPPGAVQKNVKALYKSKFERVKSIDTGTHKRLKEVARNSKLKFGKKRKE